MGEMNKRILQAVILDRVAVPTARWCRRRELFTNPATESWIMNAACWLSTDGVNNSGRHQRKREKKQQKKKLDRAHHESKVPS